MRLVTGRNSSRGLRLHRELCLHPEQSKGHPPPKVNMVSAQIHSGTGFKIFSSNYLFRKSQKLEILDLTEHS